MFKDTLGKEITLGAFIIYATSKGMKMGRVTRVSSSWDYRNRIRHAMRVSVFTPNDRWSSHVTLSRPDRAVLIPESMLTPAARAYYGI